MTAGCRSLWFLIGSLEVGGTERTLVSLANELHEKGYDPVIWSITDSTPVASELHDDISLRTLDATTKIDVRAPMSFLRAVRRERPAVVQSFLFFDNVLARSSKLVSPETTVITGVRAVPTDPDTARALVDRVSMPLSDYVVSNSRAGADLAVGRGASPGDVRVIHNGRNISVYANRRATGEVRSEFGIESTAPLVGTVGRLIERKGHHDLLTAWPDVRDEFPNSHLLIVGNGPRREELEQQCRRLSVLNSVHFAGTREDVPNLLAAMDLFVFPSHFEGLPGALLEAMTAGLPVVATAIPGNDELLTDDDTGVLVRPASPGAIADSVNGILSNPSRAESLGDRAQAVARTDFSLEAMTAAFESLYRDVAPPAVPESRTSELEDS